MITLAQFAKTFKKNLPCGIILKETTNGSLFIEFSHPDYPDKDRIWFSKRAQEIIKKAKKPKLEDYLVCMFEGDDGYMIIITHKSLIKATKNSRIQF